jgi:hypothetical protein
MSQLSVLVLTGVLQKKLIVTGPANPVPYEILVGKRHLLIQNDVGETSANTGQKIIIQMLALLLALNVM